MKILTKRLREFLNPFSVLGIDETLPEGYRVPGFIEVNDRDDEYHYGRIQGLIGRFRAGEKVEPIQIDCRTGRMCVYAWPVLLDGHHRFAAALLAGVEKIEADFGGRVDLKHYLQGKRKTCPQD